MWINMVPHGFDKDTTLNEINDINNLMALCRNCHWEFDNGLISL